MSNGESREIQRFITPSTFEQAMEMASKLATSDLVPQAYRGKPANVVIAWEMGAELGLSPMTSLQSIAVINGKPSLYGEAPLAVVISSGHLEEITEDWDAETETATCTVKRKGWAKPVVRTFSMADARKAKVYERDQNGGGGKWIPLAERWSYQSWGRDMCAYRARGRALKVVFADVLKGVDVAEAAIHPGEGAPTGTGDVIDMEQTGANAYMPGTKKPDPEPSGNAVPDPTATKEAEAPAQPEKRGPGRPRKITPETGAGAAQAGGSASPVTADTAPAAAPAQEAPTPSQAVADPVLAEQEKEDPGAAQRVAEAVAEMQAEETNAGEGGNDREIPSKAEGQTALPGTTPPAEEKPPAPVDGPQEYDIAGTMYKTKGITRDQLLETFKLIPAVDRAKGKGTSKKILAQMFTLQSRMELTKAKAALFIKALEKELK